MNFFKKLLAEPSSLMPVQIALADHLIEKIVSDGLKDIHIGLIVNFISKCPDLCWMSNSGQPVLYCSDPENPLVPKALRLLFLLGIDSLDGITRAELTPCGGQFNYKDSVRLTTVLECIIARRAITEDQKSVVITQGVPHLGASDIPILLSAMTQLDSILISQDGLRFKPATERAIQIATAVQNCLYTYSHRLPPILSLEILGDQSYDLLSGGPFIAFRRHLDFIANKNSQVVAA